MSTDTARKPQGRMPDMERKATERDRDRLIDVLERDLAAAQAEKQAVLDHATSVVRLFEQMHKRLESVEQHMQTLDQRLQQLSQRREGEVSHALPKSLLLDGKSHAPVRYTILEILQGHPEGMTREQIETAVGTAVGKRKALANTISHMKRDKLITSKTLGVYVLPAFSGGKSAQGTAG
jgi:hypothetical protein